MMQQTLIWLWSTIFVVCADSDYLIKFDPTRYPWFNPPIAKGQSLFRSSSAILDVFMTNLSLFDADSAGWQASLLTPSGGRVFDVKDVVYQGWNTSVAHVGNRSEFFFTRPPQMAIQNQTMVVLYHHHLMILQDLDSMQSFTLPAVDDTATLLANDVGVYVARWIDSPAEVDIVAYHGLSNTSLGSYDCDNNGPVDSPAIAATGRFLLLYSSRVGLTLLDPISLNTTVISHTSFGAGVIFNAYTSPYLSPTALVYSLQDPIANTYSLRYLPLTPRDDATPVPDYATSYQLKTELDTVEAVCLCNDNPALTVFSFTLPIYNSAGSLIAFAFGVRLLNNTAWPAGRSATGVYYTDWTIALNATHNVKLELVSLTCSKDTVIVDFQGFEEYQLFRFSRPLSELAALLKPYPYAPVSIPDWIVLTTSTPATTNTTTTSVPLSQHTSYPHSPDPAPTDSPSKPTSTSLQSTSTLSSPVTTSSAASKPFASSSTAGPLPSHSTSQSKLILTVSIAMAAICLVVIFIIARTLARRQQASRSYYMLALDRLEEDMTPSDDDLTKLMSGQSVGSSRMPMECASWIETGDVDRIADYLATSPFQPGQGLEWINLACRAGHATVLQLLLDNVSDVDLSRWDQHGLCPIHYAVRAGSSACVQALAARVPLHLADLALDGDSVWTAALKYAPQLLALLVSLKLDTLYLRLYVGETVLPVEMAHQLEDQSAIDLLERTMHELSADDDGWLATRRRLEHSVTMQRMKGKASL
eukprot:m.209127 g.209127  ORF g.209127 m.209127 type:complete len:757 (-) comp17135_c0_seq5:105-2375(-)